MLDHIRQNDEREFRIGEWNGACRYAPELVIPPNAPKLPQEPDMARQRGLQQRPCFRDERQEDFSRRGTGAPRCSMIFHHDGALL
jgi:hypothetical protein